MAFFEKGNAIVGQSGGPTSAINATLAGVIKGCFANGSIEKIYGMCNGTEGLLEENLIDIKDYFNGARDKNLDLLASTPAAALGSCRQRMDDEACEKIFSILEKYDIRYFFYIGGNDSMDTVLKLATYADAHPDIHQANFIGIPKTIDNDLMLTDHTPGYGSAAKYIAVSMQEIMRDVSVYKTKAVTIVEIMGRDAGWLTASSALTNHLCGMGPDLIYLPETPFSESDFISDVNAKLENSDFVVVAVSEGIRNEVGNYVGESAMNGISDTFGHKYLAGTGKYLENLIRTEIGCKVRSVELNILQRCASHIASKTDIEESIRIGEAAVRHAVLGETGKMAVLQRVADIDEYACEIAVENIENIANKIKKMPKAFIDVENRTVTQKCIDYMLPLIQGEYPSQYEDGIPIHFVF